MRSRADKPPEVPSATAGPIPRSRPSPWLSGPLAAALLTTILLAPFVDKAFHVDDTLFLAAARQIREDPLRPYSFEYNWFGAPMPMWRATKNPPLNSYLLAAVGMVAGDREVVYHLAYLAAAVGCALLMYSLARRLCDSPFLAVAFTVASPAFVVSATNVMADVPLLLFWLLAVDVGLRAAETERPARLWWVGLAASAAVMTKYFGAALVPLLAMHWILRTRRMSVHLAALGLPLLTLAAWGLYAAAAGGGFHPLSAAAYSVGASRRLAQSWSMQSGSTLAFLGGGLAWPIFALPAIVRVRRWITVAVLAAVVVLALACFASVPSDVRLPWIVMVLGGAGLLALALEAWRRRPDPDTTLLALWMLGTIGFVLTLNWTVSARAILPAAFPAAVLVLRGFREMVPSRKWYPVLALAATALLSVVLGFADRQWANAGRDFVQSTIREVVSQPSRGSGKVRMSFLGHWGFQYYMERQGIPAVDLRSPVHTGDLVVVARNNTNVQGIRYAVKTARIDRVVRSTWFLQTMNPVTGAGFYSSLAGPVPFAPARGRPADRFTIYELVRSNRAPP